MPTPWEEFLAKSLATSRPVKNVAADTRVLHIDGQEMPVTLNFGGEPDTSWVASLRNSYGPYARAEVGLVGISGIAGVLSIAASKAVERVLGFAGLSGGLYLNNWQLATNLFGPAFTVNPILKACALLHNDYPRQPVVVRSLTPAIHQGLLNDLVGNGFLLIPTRQVWLVDTLASGAWRQHSDVKKDLVLEAKGGFEWVAGDNFTSADYERALLLYDQLYRGKYPAYNPDYTESFFRVGVESGWLSLYGLRKPGYPLSGIVGIVRQGEWFATPVLGYDLAIPQKVGLYRRLMLHAFKTVETSGGKLHCSGGAGKFKKQRGAYPAVEYAAVSTTGMRRSQRLALSMLSSLLLRAVVPYMKNRAL